MSLRPGSSAHPDSLRSAGAFTVAPQRGQLNSPPETWAPHHWQTVGTPGADGAGNGARGGGWTGCEYCTGAAGSTGEGTGARLTALPQEVQKLAVSRTSVPQFVQNMVVIQIVIRCGGGRTSTGCRCVP